MVDVHKYHGTGNDFVVVDAAEEVPDRRAFAADLCDRTDGIEPPRGEAGTTGADGVLFLSLETAYSPPRVVMTLVQPDGSVAAMCGNGARVAARWVADRTGSDEVMIDTPAGTRRAVLDRGTRADEVQQGQGIGLSVVAELLALYHGALRIEESDLGGARVVLQLPGLVKIPA